MQRLHIINKAILLSNLANVPFTTRFSQIRKTFFRIIGQKKNTQHMQKIQIIMLTRASKATFKVRGRYGVATE